MTRAIIVLSLALVACDINIHTPAPEPAPEPPPCSLAELRAGRSECAEAAFDELECMYHGMDRAEQARELTFGPVTSVVTGPCNEHITIRVAKRGFPRATFEDSTPTLVGLGFTTITACVLDDCETSTHTAPHVIHPRTILTIDALGGDASPYLPELFEQDRKRSSR